MPAIVFGGNDNYLAEAFQAGEEIDFQNIWKEKYGVSLIMEQTSEAEVNDLANELPTDTHIVTATSLAGDLVVEAVRAYKKSDIFDAYFDTGYEFSPSRAAMAPSSPSSGKIPKRRPTNDPH